MIEYIIEEFFEWVWNHMRNGKRKLFWVRYLLVTVAGMFGATLLFSFLHFRVSTVVSDVILYSAIGLWIALGVWWFVQAIVQKRYFDAAGVLTVGLLVAAVVFVLGSIGA